jgi:hypothetical protein
MALQLTPPALAVTALPLAKPALATISGLSYADGTPVAAGDVSLVGVFAFRGASGAGEIWDGAARRWRATPSDSEIMTLQPLVALPQQGVSGTWSATLVGIGQKDAAGNNVYDAATGGTPRYYLRAFAQASRAGAPDSGLSAPTAAFTFVDTLANKRFVTEFDTPTTEPDAAHRVRLLLKSDALEPAGYVEIRSQPGFEVEIANCDAAGNALAKVLLSADGAIHLLPASGARVVIESDLETNRILYAPFGGGPKQWLA